jgi:hypothetical protein
LIESGVPIADSLRFRGDKVYAIGRTPESAAIMAEIIAEILAEPAEL